MFHHLNFSLPKQYIFFFFFGGGGGGGGGGNVDNTIYLYHAGLCHWHWDNCMMYYILFSRIIEQYWYRWTVHDIVIKWKHFPHYWPFVWGIHRSPVNIPHKGQWHRALMFSLISAWKTNNHEAGDLRHHHTLYDATVMIWLWSKTSDAIWHQ